MSVAVVEEQVKPTVRIPTESVFGGAEFRMSGELEELAAYLIAKFPGRLGHLKHASVQYLWKAKGGKSKGRPTFGKTQKPSGLLGFYSGCDFVIWLAADHCIDAAYTMAQIEPLLFHEMLHTSLNNDNEPEVLGHDYEGFSAEIEAYGLWSSSARHIGGAIRQLNLEGFR